MKGITEENVSEVSQKIQLLRNKKFSQHIVDKYLEKNEKIRLKINILLDKCLEDKKSDTSMLISLKAYLLENNNLKIELKEEMKIMYKIEGEVSQSILRNLSN